MQVDGLHVHRLKAQLFRAQPDCSAAAWLPTHQPEHRLAVWALARIEHAASGRRLRPFAFLLHLNQLLSSRQSCLEMARPYVGQGMLPAPIDVCLIRQPLHAAKPEHKQQG